MPLDTCGEVLLTTLQNVFSTTVGVAFAYPILSQIVDIKNEKTLRECNRVMKIAEKYHGKIGLSHLGREKNQYQFKLDGLSNLNSYLTFFSALIGVMAFLLLIFSAVSLPVCISSQFSAIICVLFSMPFAAGVFQLIRWYDAHSRLQGAIAYYRGDYRWKRGKNR